MPAISRDGHRLAYGRSGVINVNIWQVALEAPTRAGGPPARLIASSRTQQSPAFSPDGRRLTFESTRSGTPEIWISDADGSNASALTAFGGPLTGSPKWSPDGRFIAFDSRAEGRANIYVVRSDGAQLRRVATGVTDSSQPTWSIDGKWLYFRAKVDGVDRIFKIPVEGGEATQITKGEGMAPECLPMAGGSITPSRAGKPRFGRCRQKEATSGASPDFLGCRKSSLGPGHWVRRESTSSIRSHHSESTFSTSRARGSHASWTSRGDRRHGHI